MSQSHIRGKGNYFGDFGAGLGRDAGNWISKIFGMGDYRIKKNSLMMYNAGPPAFGSGSTEIMHREYLQDISSSTGFSIQAFPINPGLEGTFPWLSVIAQNFECYELLGLVFEFKSTSATAVSSTNTALGTVILSTEYDSINPPFASKQEMEAHEFTVATAPSGNVLHAVECDPRSSVLPQLYLRSSVNPSGTDIRLYDMGTFYIATQGMQAVSTIGELWVSYHVRLLKPQLVYQPSQLGYAHIRSTNGASGGAFQAPVTIVSGALPVAFDSSVGIVLDQGQYFIHQFQDNTSGVLVGAPTVSGGATLLTVFTDNTGVSNYSYQYQVNSGGTQSSCTIMVSVDAGGGNVYYNNGIHAAWVDTFVLQVPVGVSFKKATLESRLIELEKRLSSTLIVNERPFAEEKEYISLPRRLTTIVR